MQLCSSFPLVDEILLSHATSLGGDLHAYRNHIYRVLNYFIALSSQSTCAPETVLIASAFHDLGIWTDRTFDYLEPSVREAKAYLATRGLEGLAPEVQALITEHHKLRPYRGPFAIAVETYRKADLIDVSLGMVRFGLPATFIRSVNAAYPNAGFHWRLTTLTLKQLLRSPLRPLPMIRW